METKTQIFSDFDFDKVKDFNETDVCAEIIEPILKQLGFSGENIVREKHFELQSGSKKQKTTLIPDYLLKVGESYAWVLEAKSPDKNITDLIRNDFIKQAYSYAAHIEIRSVYFALCNGVEFVVFRTSDPEKTVLSFQICEIDAHWEALKKLLSVNSFKNSENVIYDRVIISQKNEKFDYANRPLLKEILVRKQAAKRYFGCNAYFTRQSWDVVQSYIKNYTRPDDLVLDPFGGSGITAVESLITNRKSIHIDINPLSIFLVKALVAPVKMSEFSKAFEEVKEEFLKEEPKTEEEIEKALKKYKLPPDLALPKNSDVDSVYKLFNKRQLAQLALLKTLIKKQKNANIRDSLLLAFYNTITKCNLTFHKTPKGGGNHFGFYYCYRMAYEPTELPVMEVFEKKFKRIFNGKKEIEGQCILNKTTVEEIVENLKNIKGTATDLSFLDNESVDYIYTDPPYGKNIAYLDLSIMWNAWLDFEVSEKDYELEAIEGGDHDKTKQSYKDLIAKSIEEMFRVLKFDRWLSFVFAHKDPEFWHLIIETAEKCGFEYVGAVAQKNGQTTFKKRKHPFTVLSGELIINFRKTRNPKSIMKANLGMDISEIVMQTIEGIIAKHNGATIEQINDELIIKGLELGFLHELKKKYSDLTPILTNNFDYNSETELYTIRKNSKFTTHIDINLRIRYYLISYLRQMERERKTASFDEIVMNIMPLLKNGVTPEKQTILNVLEDIAEQVGADFWRLKEEKPTLFTGA